MLSVEISAMLRCSALHCIWYLGTMTTLPFTFILPKQIRFVVTRNSILGKLATIPFKISLSSHLLYKNVKIIYGAINLSFVSYRYRVLRRILGTMRGEVVLDSRKANNEALHNLYSSANMIR
jgi:hypothetical protein